MEDTGQALDGDSQHSKQLWNAHLAQLTAEHFHGWAAQVAAAAVHPLSMSTILAAMQICVCGVAEDITEHELAAFFSELMAANAAAVAPGAAVTSCKLLPDYPGSALLELRCSVEASNCLAFDGVQFKGSTLKVQRPEEYCPAAAVLLGPCQPDPAVYAVIERSSHAAHAAAGQQQQLTGAADNDHASCFTGSFASRRHSVSTGSGAAATPAGTAPSSHAASSCSFAAAVKCGGGATPCTHPTCSRIAAMAPAAVAAAGASAGTGHVTSSSSCGSAGGMPVSGGSSSTCRAASRDLLPAADQSNKQDEVFIGGLPSHWKAMQVKELLAPYGQLKSLSVAMDAATGKNKGYAFVVFASPVIVLRAIEELDCKVVEGKILAVQRATDGKAACGSSNGGTRDTISSGAGAAGSARDAAVGSIAGASSQEQPQQLQQAQQAQQHYQHRQPHRSSSGSSSSGGTGLAGAAAAGAAGGGIACSPGSDSLLAQHTQHVQHAQHAQQHHVPGAMSQQAAAALAAAAGEGGTLGQRLLAAVSGGAGAAAAAAIAGPAGLKQYDVNELYIGDLPLSWDEDAVRRLLGRYGKIKYFTLRNGRDKNFAFCKFKDSSVVDAAIQGLHGKIVDGYFLNVRRAIEGKQQQQQQWPGKQGSSSSSSSSAGGAAAGRGMYNEGGRAAQLRPGDPQQQQQQQQQKFAAKGSGYGRVPAAAAAATGAANGEAHVSVPVPAVVQGDAAKVSQPGSERPQQQQQQQQHVQIKAAATPAGTPGTAGAKAGAGAATAGGPAAAVPSRQPQQAPKQQQQQQQDDNSTAPTAPSPPKTPTAAPLVQQPAPQPAAAAAAAAVELRVVQQQQQQPLRVPSYPQQLPFQPILQQQQQQQQQQALQQPQPQPQHQMPSLFMNTGQTSWSAASDVMGSYQLFSPWSLFSPATQKGQW